MGRINDWVMSKPFKMGIISSVIVSLFAVVYHFFLVKPNNWEGFLMWLPVCWALVFVAPSLNWTYDKLSGGLK